MVGNDVRNDLLGARAAGLRTALFAGDARSLRLRRDDPRSAAVCPDLVLTHLSQLPRALRRDGRRRDAARPGLVPARLAQRRTALHRAGPRDRGLTDSLTPAGPPQHDRGDIAPVGAATRVAWIASRLDRVARSAAARRAAAQESVGLRQTPGLSDGMGQKRRPWAAVLGR